MSQSELLAAHFDEAFSAPDGLKRLRELILTLAMQGKLVEQDPNEGTADDLLRDIEAEKKRLVQVGKARDASKLTTLTADEAPYEIPVSWRWARFGEVLFNRDSERVPLSKEERVTMQGSYDFYGASGVIDKIDRYLFNEDLLLIGEDGANLINRSTPIAFMARGKYWVNNHAHVIGAHEVDFLLYIERYINSIDLKPYLTGTAQPKMNQARMNLIPVPLPPLAEQRRIVARIDQLMARCDELEVLRAQREQKRVQVHTAILREITADTDPIAFQQNWQFLADHFGELHATPQNVAELRSAVLQLAVMGKLVPQDPAEGTAQELLAEIEQEKRHLLVTGKIKAPETLPPVSEAEQPYPVPERWTWVRLGAISTTRLGKMLDQGKNRGTLKPYLRNTNVQWERFELDDIKEMKLEAEELEEFAVTYGDLLICEGGEPGRCAIWREAGMEMYFQKALHRVRPFSLIMPEWVLFALKNDAQSKQLDKYFTGATIKHFPGEKLMMYFFPLPPLAEQRRIVTKVDQLMGLCDVLESRLHERTAKQRELLRAVMAELAPTSLSTRPTVASRARAQAPAAAEAPRGRGRPREAVAEDAELRLTEQAGERRGRGRPRKDASIPTANSMEDAIRLLEAQKLERARGTRQVSLFAVDD